MIQSKMHTKSTPPSTETDHAGLELSWLSLTSTTAARVIERRGLCATMLYQHHPPTQVKSSQRREMSKEREGVR